MSRCGPGSSKEMTVAIRGFLWKILSSREIKIVNDLGCGDLYWYSLEKYPSIYRGYDDNVRDEARDRLVQGMSLIEGDIRTCDLLPCDLTICKDVLRHHDDIDAEQIIQNIKKSSKYLLADYDKKHTSGPRHHTTQKGDVNYDFSGNRVDVRLWLGEPIESVESDETTIKRYGLWKLSP